MEKVTFALPTVASADMSKDDQGALIVNQATAFIISAYLAHAVVMYQGGETSYAITTTELLTLIDDVQDKLKSF